MPTKQHDDKIFSKEERDAVAATARERKASAKLGPEQLHAQGEKDVRDAIAKLPPDVRAMAERIHALVTQAAPSLTPRTYYGMPAYASPGKDGKTICFFKPMSKFSERYSTFGFETTARLDDGPMWPVAFAVVQMTPEVEAKISALAKKAAG